MEDAASLARAVAGCRYLFHVAADYRLWVPDPAAMYRANVDGTRDLMPAALAAGVERVVYTSSVATLGLVPGGSADEDHAEPARRHDRALQALEIPGRGSRAPLDRASAGCRR